MNRLKKLCVRDIMKADVITLSANAPIREAVETFEDDRISGAPVVDAVGTLVGILSAHDIARTEHLRGGRIDEERSDYRYSESEGESMASDDYSPVLLGRESVKDWMSTPVVTIHPDASLKDACERMYEDSIHRLVVMEGDKLCGIVTSLDIVAALAASL